MKLLVLFISLICANGFSAEYNIYLDADMSINKASGESIRNGIETAIDIYQQRNQGTKFKINLKVLDHRGNTRRSLANFKKALKDPKMIAVFGGLHSPPLITNKNFINSSQIPTLVSWAAGGPITRAPAEKNWIFRLSIDDNQAGGFIVNEAKKSGCKSPFLILEKTPWGKSNEKNMKTALIKNNIKDFDISFFNWGITKASAAEISEKIIQSKNDCIFFVGNSSDVKNIFNALGSRQVKMPIFSHWGINGSKPKEIASLISKNKLKVKIIQTKFSFLESPLNDFQRKILSHILKKYNLKSPSQIIPMTGWVNSFDLTKILLHAIEKIDHTKNINEKRIELKRVLENQDQTISGLIKDYKKPFNIKNKDRFHEALNLDDYILREYLEDGSLR